LAPAATVKVTLAIHTSSLAFQLAIALVYQVPRVAVVLPSSSAVQQCDCLLLASCRHAVMQVLGSRRRRSLQILVSQTDQLTAAGIWAHCL
jgi:hypothetical protein